MGGSPRGNAVGVGPRAAVSGTGGAQQWSASGVCAAGIGGTINLFVSLGWIYIPGHTICIMSFQDLKQWRQCAVERLWRSMAGVSFLLFFRRRLSELSRELFSQSVG